MKRILVLACLLLLLPTVEADSPQVFFALTEEPLPDCSNNHLMVAVSGLEVINVSVNGAEVVSFFLCFDVNRPNESMIFDFDFSLSEDENYTLSIPIVSMEVEAGVPINFSFSLVPPNENRTDELKVSISTEHDSNVTAEINFRLHVSETVTPSESADVSVPAMGILATTGVIAVAALFLNGKTRRNDDLKN
jgi:hypothetical protein